MGLFSSSKKISFDDVEDILRNISSMTSSEREYVRGVFSQYRSGGGISKREINLAIHELKENGHDYIGNNQASRIKDELLSALENK